MQWIMESTQAIMEANRPTATMARPHSGSRFWAMVGMTLSASARLGYSTRPNRPDIYISMQIIPTEMRVRPNFLKLLRPTSVMAIRRMVQ